MAFECSTNWVYVYTGKHLLSMSQLHKLSIQHEVIIKQNIISKCLKKNLFKVTW